MRLPIETEISQARYITNTIIFVLLICAAHLSGEDSIGACTEDGKGVLLHEDGSWEYTGRIGFFDVEKSEISSIEEISIRNLLRCTITKIVDGDTIEVGFVDPPPGIRTGESVRLLGIDAPEIRPPTGPVPFASEAHELVSDLVADSIVYLAFESRWRDSFGRLLADVFNSKGILLNSELLSHGLAAVYNATPSYFHQRFVSLEFDARSESKGMWTTPLQGEVVIRQVFNDDRAEYVELWNRSDQTIDVSGWYLSDEQLNRVELPRDSWIPARGSLHVVSGSGTPPSSNYVYGTKASIWNNNGDIARLYDEEGELVTEYGY